jgi:pimeloyl-ACP methyl ester carboxylesterase
MKNKGIYRSANGQQKLVSYYDTLLQHLPENAEKKMINSSWGNTFVITCGDPDKKPLLLLHGTSSNSAMWLNEISTLSNKYFVIAVDIPGECGKSAAVRAPFKDANYASWLNEMLKTWPLESIHLAGYSLGAWIALDFAIHFPEKVEKLVLFAPAGLVPVKIKSIFWIILTSFFGKGGYNQLNKMVYKNYKPDKSTREFADLIRKYFIPRTDILPLFLSKDLRKITASVYYYGGNLDCFYNSKKAAEKLSSSGIRCHYQILKKQGHILLDLSSKIQSALDHE